jgi:hypothetical protein
MSKPSHRTGKQQQRRAWAAAVATFLLGALAAAAPGIDRGLARRTSLARLSALSLSARALAVGDRPLACVPGAARADRLGPLLAGWQTVGGCGAGASTGSGMGVKWIGRGVTGGLFGVQCQLTYTRLAPDPERPEHHAFGAALVTRNLGERWILGAGVPVVFKYLNNPFENGADVSNSGLGDVSAQLTHKFGAIGATAATVIVGFPTGQFDGKYRNRILNQSQQRGFGKYAASLMIDHTSDETWGLTVLGVMGSWRGGKNAVDSYRAPTASAYAYAGYFLGPLVPAIGLSLTGATDHDRDQTEVQVTGLYTAAANVSIEWSNDWLAILVGASVPYQYDGLHDVGGHAKSPWGWGPWVVGLGVAFSPF